MIVWKLSNEILEKGFKKIPELLEEVCNTITSRGGSISDAFEVRQTVAKVATCYIITKLLDKRRLYSPKDLLAAIHEHDENVWDSDMRTAIWKVMADGGATLTDGRMVKIFSKPKPEYVAWP